MTFVLVFGIVPNKNAADYFQFQSCIALYCSVCTVYTVYCSVCTVIAKSTLNL